MAFESLSDKLQNVFKNLRGKGRLSEADVKTALKEVKMALLEADVSFKVVKQFISSVQERAVGEEVLGSLQPGQMVIKIVNEELIRLMGSGSNPAAPDQRRQTGCSGLLHGRESEPGQHCKGRYGARGKEWLQCGDPRYRRTSSCR